MNISDLIGSVLSCEPNPNSGMNNQTFVLTAENGQYLHRVPGEGTDLFCNREWEKTAYRVLAGTGLTDEPIAIDTNGEKLTIWFPDSRTCDPSSAEDVHVAMSLLRRLHHLPVKLCRRADLFERMLYFGEIAGDTLLRRQEYRECVQVLEDNRQIFAYTDENLCPIHGDALPGNFLFRKDAPPILIDLEFAAMGHAFEDLAGFCHDARYSIEQSEMLLEVYLQRAASEEEKRRLHLFTAAAALMWAGWAVHKQHSVPEKEDFFREYAEMSLCCAVERCLEGDHEK